MKQHITAEQWQELPNEHKDEFDKLSTAINKYALPTIGDMIAFLEATDSMKGTAMGTDSCMRHVNIVGDKCLLSWDGELCDALWEAVKEKLNKT